MFEEAAPLGVTREEVMVVVVCGISVADEVITETTGVGIESVEITIDSEKVVKVMVSWKTVTG